MADQPTLAATLIEPPPAEVVADLAAPGLVGRPALGLELILEGFLLHHGRARHVQVADATRILAGDWCYAHGLVDVAEAGDLTVIALLADLVALSASLVATGDRDVLPALWRATVAVIARRDPDEEVRLDAAKAALRAGNPGPLRELAAALDPTPLLDEVLLDA